MKPKIHPLSSDSSPLRSIIEIHGYECRSRRRLAQLTFKRAQVYPSDEPVPHNFLFAIESWSSWSVSAFTLLQDDWWQFSACLAVLFINSLRTLLLGMVLIGQRRSSIILLQNNLYLLISESSFRIPFSDLLAVDHVLHSPYSILHVEDSFRFIVYGLF